MLRFRAPDVKHVPVAGLPCGRATLFSFLSLRALRDPRPEVVTARFRAGFAALARSFQPDLIYIGGGLSERPDLRAAIAGVPASRRVLWAREGRFVGEVGGRAIAGASALVCDVGQTAVKVSGADGRRIHERPMPQPGSDGCDLAGIAFIRDVLAREVRTAGPEAALVLSLPGELSDDFTPGHCSYRWGGRVGLMEELLPGPIRGGREILVLNDAELAAESARVEVRPSAETVCLVLTLGYAPGAALLGGARGGEHAPISSGAAATPGR